MTLSHRETTLAGEECSLAPEKVLALLGVQREGRVEKADVSRWLLPPPGRLSTG